MSKVSLGTVGHGFAFGAGLLFAFEPASRCLWHRDVREQPEIDIHRLKHFGVRAKGDVVEQCAKRRGAGRRKVGAPKPIIGRKLAGMLYWF